MSFNAAADERRRVPPSRAATLQVSVDEPGSVELPRLGLTASRRGGRATGRRRANAKRLQAVLAGAGIGYRHHPELAPTTELRQLQYREDDRLGVGKRSREELAPEYRRRYLSEILERADLAELIAELPDEGAGALFCVERDHEACHRSLIADRIAAEYGVPVTHLRPS